MDTRDNLLNEIWLSQDEAYEMMAEYDSLPHHYGNNVLYQAEAYIINLIGKSPDITITELSEALKKTSSACSQIVRKLVEKGFVIQERNSANKRIYNLRLTADGENVYREHTAFNQSCQKATFDMLSEFGNAELEIYLRIQKCINNAYRSDVERSREYFVSQNTPG